MENQTIQQILETIDFSLQSSISYPDPLDRKYRTNELTGVIPFQEDVLMIDTKNSSLRSLKESERKKIREVISYIYSFVNYLKYARTPPLNINIAAIEGDGINIYGETKALQAVYSLIESTQLLDPSQNLELRAVALRNPRDDSWKMQPGENIQLFVPEAVKQMTNLKNWEKLPLSHKKEIIFAINLQRILSGQPEMNLEVSPTAPFPYKEWEELSFDNRNCVVNQVNSSRRLRNDSEFTDSTSFPANGYCKGMPENEIKGLITDFKAEYHLLQENGRDIPEPWEHFPVGKEKLDRGLFAISIKKEGTTGEITDPNDQIRLRDEITRLLKEAALYGIVDIKISHDGGRLSMYISLRSNVTEEEAKFPMRRILDVLYKFALEHRELDIDVGAFSGERLTYINKYDPAHPLIDFYAQGVNNLMHLPAPSSRPSNGAPNLFIYNTEFVPPQYFIYGPLLADGRRNIERTTLPKITSLNSFIAQGLVPSAFYKEGLSALRTFAWRIQSTMHQNNSMDNNNHLYGATNQELDNFRTFNLTGEILPEIDLNESLVFRFRKMRANHNSNVEEWNNILKVLTIIKNIKGAVTFEHLLKHLQGIIGNDRILNIILEELALNGFVFYDPGRSIVVPDYIATEPHISSLALDETDRIKIADSTIQNLQVITQDYPYTLIEQGFVMSNRTNAKIALSLVKAQGRNQLSITLGDATKKETVRTFDQLIDSLPEVEEKQMLSFYKYCALADYALISNDIKELKEAMCQMTSIIKGSETIKRLGIKDLEIMEVVNRILRNVNRLITCNDNLQESLGSTFKDLTEASIVDTNIPHNKKNKKEPWKDVHTFLTDSSISIVSRTAFVNQLTAQTAAEIFPSSENITTPQVLINYLNTLLIPENENLLKERYMYYFVTRMINLAWRHLVPLFEKDPSSIEKELNDIQRFVSFLSQIQFYPDLLGKLRINLARLFSYIYTRKEPLQPGAIIQYSGRALADVLELDILLIMQALNNTLMSVKEAIECRNSIIQGNVVTLVDGFIITKENIIEMVDTFCSPNGNAFTVEGKIVDPYLWWQISHTLLSILKHFPLNEDLERISNLAINMWMGVLNEDGSNHDDIISNLNKLLEEYPQLYKQLFEEAPSSVIRNSTVKSLAYHSILTEVFSNKLQSLEPGGPERQKIEALFLEEFYKINKLLESVNTKLDDLSLDTYISLVNVILNLKSNSKFDLLVPVTDQITKIVINKILIKLYSPKDRTSIADSPQKRILVSMLESLGHKRAEIQSEA